MARKSQRLSAASQATPAHKRAASNSDITSAGSKRTRKGAGPKETPQKSQYFHADRSEGDDDEEDPTSADEEGSDFDEDEEKESPPSDPDEHDEYDSDDDKPKRSSKSTPKKGATTSADIRAKGQEVWRPGVKTGLGPGNQVVIKKPKARTAGNTLYEDETIHPNTLSFLADLKQNNDRQWLKMNDADFRQSEKDWHAFVDKVTERLIEIDDTVPELPVKDVIFRIYRDVRFSPDPTPYKPHFSAAWSRTGRKGPYAHYYLQISGDGKSFLGGGLWHPEAAPVAAMRREFDRHPQRIKAVLTQDGVRKAFLKGAPKSDAKAVKAFVAGNADNALKTKPKGFDADHPEIELLRLRNYTIGRALDEAEVTSPKFLDRVAELLTCMKPFITYLNSVVMPDEEEEDDDDEDGDEEEGGEDRGENSASSSEGEE